MRGTGALAQVSKSALFAVGAPHTWPGLLAALAWLVEMLNYEEKAAASRANSFDDRARPLAIPRALCHPSSCSSFETRSIPAVDVRGMAIQGRRHQSVTQMVPARGCMSHRDAAHESTLIRLLQPSLSFGAKTLTRPDCDIAGEPGERDFFEYVAESYRFFLAADDAQCEAVDAAKAAQFEARAGSVRDDIDGLEQARGFALPDGLPGRQS